MKPLILPKFTPNPNKTYAFDVPASKSVAARVLLLAALANGTVRIRHSDFCEDTETMLACLKTLGVRMNDENGILTVCGTDGSFPVKKADLFVGSAGTVARFLPAVLAVGGGEYRFNAAEQMKRRPMNFLGELERAGAKIEYSDREGAFPFILRSKKLESPCFTVDTDTSTQFASGLLLAAATGNGVRVRLTGGRTDSDYLSMTLALLRRFGYAVENDANTVSVRPNGDFPAEFDLEADVSSACYFYALSLLFRTKVFVRNVDMHGLQGDVAFLKLLETRGVVFSQTTEGLFADARSVKTFIGFQENFQNFSDQTLTAAAIAPFASTPTRLTGIAHIRKQECDRIAAIEENLKAIGVPVRTEDGIVFIEPSPPCGGEIRSFGDHRVAMSFALTALKTGNVAVDDPDCCKKTFKNYFQMLLQLV